MHIPNSAYCLEFMQFPIDAKPRDRLK
jgi:hypothetical protein